MEKLSEKKKELLKEFVDYKCRTCKSQKESKELEIHRIKQGGEYYINNLQVECIDCHKLLSSAQRIASEGRANG